MTPAEEGRKLLAEWKAAHSQQPHWCAGEWYRAKPCPTARLIAAVEEALEYIAFDSVADRKETEDAILAKLTEGR